MADRPQSTVPANPQTPQETTPARTPCPDCGGQVVIHSDWVQTCTACPWRWLPPSMRPLVRRPSITEIVCV